MKGKESDSDFDIRESITRTLETSKHLPGSVEELVELIIDHCSGAFFGRTRSVNDNIQFLEFFAKEIRKVVSSNLFAGASRLRVNFPIERGASSCVHKDQVSFQTAVQ